MAPFVSADNGRGGVQAEGEWKGMHMFTKFAHLTARWSLWPFWLKFKVPIVSLYDVHLASLGGRPCKVYCVYQSAPGIVLPL